MPTALFPDQPGCSAKPSSVLLLDSFERSSSTCRLSGWSLRMCNISIHDLRSSDPRILRAHDSPPNHLTLKAFRFLSEMRDLSAKEEISMKGKGRQLEVGWAVTVSMQKLYAHWCICIMHERAGLGSPHASFSERRSKVDWCWIEII